MRGFLTGAAIAVAGMAWASAADASPIRYAFSGTITSADPSTGVAAGTPFSGIVSYDLADMTFGGPNIEGHTQAEYGQSMYVAGSKPDGSGLSLNIGGTPFFDHQGGISIGVDEAAYPYQDGYSTSAHSGLWFSNNNVLSGSTEVGLNLNNPSRDVIGSLTVPTSLSLADFPAATLIVTGNAASPSTKTLFSGTITSLTPMPVPEPSALAVIGLGAAAWIARALRRPTPGA